MPLPSVFSPLSPPLVVRRRVGGVCARSSAPLWAAVRSQKRSEMGNTERTRRERNERTTPGARKSNSLPTCVVVWLVCVVWCVVRAWCDVPPSPLPFAARHHADEAAPWARTTKRPPKRPAPPPHTSPADVHSLPAAAPPLARPSIPSLGSLAPFSAFLRFPGALNPSPRHHTRASPFTHVIERTAPASRGRCSLSPSRVASPLPRSLRLSATTTYWSTTPVNLRPSKSGEKVVRAKRAPNHTSTHTPPALPPLPPGRPSLPGCPVGASSSSERSVSAHTRAWRWCIGSRFVPASGSFVRSFAAPDDHARTRTTPSTDAGTTHAPEVIPNGRTCLAGCPPARPPVAFAAVACWFGRWPPSHFKFGWRPPLRRRKQPPPSTTQTRRGTRASSDLVGQSVSRLCTRALTRSLVLASRSLAVRRSRPAASTSMGNANNKANRYAEAEQRIRISWAMPSWCIPDVSRREPRHTSPRSHLVSTRAAAC